VEFLGKEKEKKVETIILGKIKKKAKKGDGKEKRQPKRTAWCD